MPPGLILPLRNFGLPPWPELQNQRTIRYSDRAFVHQSSSPWVCRLIDTMLEGLDRALIDVRFWPLLRAGDFPGPPKWHRDEEKVGGGRHRIYAAGAGSFTEFWPNQPIAEGWIVEYRDIHAHRITAATSTGPRFFVRVSETERMADNRFVPPPLISSGA